MTQVHNRYPNIKAASYTMFCKYVPESTDNKNESTTMCNRTATGVSFYQRSIPVNGTPVSGTNVISEDMISCWKCGCRGHISPFCPKYDDKGFQGM